MSSSEPPQPPSHSSQPNAKRGRKRNDNLPPNRARDVQRAFRARRAAHLEALEARVQELEDENAQFRVALNLPPANRPPLGKGPTGKDKPKSQQPPTLATASAAVAAASSSRSPSQAMDHLDLDMDRSTGSPASMRTASLSPSIDTSGGGQWMQERQPVQSQQVLPAYHGAYSSPTIAQPSRPMSAQAPQPHQQQQSQQQMYIPSGAPAVEYYAPPAPPLPQQQQQPPPQESYYDYYAAPPQPPPHRPEPPVQPQQQFYAVPQQQQQPLPTPHSQQQRMSYFPPPQANPMARFHRLSPPRGPYGEDAS